ncbi:TetR/AcrR family transcriptional regulator [Mycobacterium syngnathidarum]
MPGATRSSQPSGDAPTPRDALVSAGIAMMRSQPWRHVSAKQIAEFAGVEPALVTYYFGGRSGLVIAVAREAASILRESMALDYDVDDTVAAEEQMLAAVRDPLLVLAREPLLARLYVAELLLNPNRETDVILRETGVAYFEKIRDIVRHAASRDDGIDDGRGTLVYVITALALFPWFLEPWLRRSGHPVRDEGDVDAFAASLTDVILHGYLAGGAGRAPTERGGDAKFAGPDRGELVDAAIGLMCADPRITPTADLVAAATDCDPAAVHRHFTDTHALLTAVAVEATLRVSALRRAPQALTAIDAEPRRRGRPAAQDPVIERKLLDSALTLVESGGRAASARAVASRVGCDPALITYYFGGRDGMYQRLAEEIVADLVAVFLHAVHNRRSPRMRMRLGLTALVEHIAGRPNVTRFLLEQCLIEGTVAGDVALAGIATPYFDAVAELTRLLAEQGSLRPLGAAIDPYAVAVLPVFLAAFVPIMHRALGGPLAELPPAEVASAIVRFLMSGARTER